MKILLTGRDGQVGWELERNLMTVGEIVAFDRKGLNLADPDSIVCRIREVRPDVIVNAAAYTGVDAAETDEVSASAVNSLAPGIIAEEARSIGALVIHYSTDYVFDGSKPTPYAEVDAVGPLNAYGRTKLAGEAAIVTSGCRHLILRTGWLYAARGHNFFLTILRRAAEGRTLRIVADQYGSPTPAAAIARTTAELLQAKRVLDGSSLYHLTSAGSTSWHGFASAIIGFAESSVLIDAIKTEDYPTPAHRPRQSTLNCGRLLADHDVSLPDWRVGLGEVFRELAKRT